MATATVTTEERFVVERLIKRQWRETGRFSFNLIDRLGRLPDPHLRRMTDLTTGDVWTWAGASRGYQVSATNSVST